MEIISGDCILSADEMAIIHEQAFTEERPWTSEEFENLISQSSTRSLAIARCFVLGRFILGELEILTFACAPLDRRQGYASALLLKLLAMASREGGHSAFLEVAADNLAAIALYHKFAFEQVGCRTNYYKRRDGTRCDALTLRKQPITSQ
jgi:ribosomal-protein-alanine N-acetyltransferase